MKKAFTMIEPIFVIAIMGILAAVIISKINATRDDAKLTKVMSEITVAIQDINTYYMSEGKLAIDTKNNRVDFRAMTNAGVIDSSGNLSIFAKNERCISLKFFAVDQSCLGGRYQRARPMQKTLGSSRI